MDDLYLNEFPYGEDGFIIRFFKPDPTRNSEADLTRLVCTMDVEIVDALEELRGSVTITLSENKWDELTNMTITNKKNDNEDEDGYKDGYEDEEEDEEEKANQLIVGEAIFSVIELANKHFPRMSG